MAHSLGLALVGASGASGGTAHRIPALLMPETVPGFRLIRLREPVRLSDGKVDGAACFRVRGMARGEHAFRVWIEQGTFRILRIDERFSFGKHQARQTVRYHPELDIPLAEEELTFLPPGGMKRKV